MFAQWDMGLRCLHFINNAHQVDLSRAWAALLILQFIYNYLNNPSEVGSHKVLICTAVLLCQYFIWIEHNVDPTAWQSYFLSPDVKSADKVLLFFYIKESSQVIC